MIDLFLFIKIEVLLWGRQIFWKKNLAEGEIPDLAVLHVKSAIEKGT
ncbi:MAG: hypothetical protein WCO84_03655 [bacterium]